MIAGEDALDQYFMRNPDSFMNWPPETAVINPDNPQILDKHLICAAAELTLQSDESFLSAKSVQARVSHLEKSGDLLRSADGAALYSRLKLPQRHINLRGIGSVFNIVCSVSGESRGEIDGFRAFRDTHPGAVYLHKGDTHIVDTLDLDTMTALLKNLRREFQRNNIDSFFCMNLPFFIPIHLISYFKFS